MRSLSSIADSDLLARMPALVAAERAATVEIIEHLVEIDRRRLFLDQACSSLYSYCTERLHYTEDAALKRVRVARLSARLPRVLDELRGGSIHLTGLFLLSQHLTEENAEALLAEARGKSRRELEQILACRFPRTETRERIVPIGPAVEPRSDPPAEPLSSDPPTSPGTGESAHPAIDLSALRYRIEFSVSAGFRQKIERARELVSHALPSGDLASLFERALDELIRHEMRRRTGSGKPRKRRTLGARSRHVPLDVARVVWERDGGRCTFVDESGRRCSERRFITLEHRHPLALGGPPTVENICLLCMSHNAHAGRRVFGEFVGARGATAPSPTEQPDVYSKVLSALRNLGFDRPSAARALNEVRHRGVELDVEPLLRAALATVAAPATAR